MRIRELEGLRGLLAWWVVVVHATELSGLTRSGQLRGYDAVMVFVVLSGFVIATLLDRSRQSYGEFLVRRFFRLYPVFVVCLAASVLLLPLERSNWQTPLLAGRDDGMLDWMAAWAEHPWRHILASLTMLHGAVPEQVLPSASQAFLIPGWSISLEWQFYLVAPLVLWLVTRRGPVALVAMAALALVALNGNVTMRWVPYGLPAHWRYFAIGIVSFYAWKSRPAARDSLLPVALYLAAFPWLDMPLRLWGLVLVVLFAPGAPVISVASSALASRPLARLGEISYSTYLVHWPVLTVYTWAHTRYFALTPLQSFAGAVLVVFPVVLAVSWAMHRWIEVPGIALGKRIAARRAPDGRLGTNPAE